MLRYKRCNVHPNQGIEFACEGETWQMNKRVYFGQLLMEVLERFGNPNKEYYSQESLFLNYLELGIDIMIQNIDHTVKKIILHAN